MLKNIIKKIEDIINTPQGDIAEELIDILEHLEKEAELQEEMAKALVDLAKTFGSPKRPNYSMCDILNLIEKYYNKKWEEIIKDGE